MRLILAFVVMLLATAGTAFAHDARPAYLEIRQLSGERYELAWRTPVLSGMRLPVALQLPESVREVTAPSTQELSDSLVERRVIEVPGGLAGRRIGFPGLQGTIADVLVRLQFTDGGTTTILARPAQPWIEIPAVARQCDRDRRRVRGAWRRTHTAGLRSPAVRPGVDDHRSQHARTGVDDYRIHARAFDHARLGNARFDSRAGTARRGGHCLLHPAACKRDRTPAARRAEPDGPLAVDRGFLVRIAARLRVRKCIVRDRLAAHRHSARAFRLQRRRGTGPARLHRRSAGRRRDRAQGEGDAPDARARDAPCPVCDRISRRVLVLRARGRLHDMSRPCG